MFATNPLVTVKRAVLLAVGVAGAVVIAGLFAWGLRVDHLRAGYKSIVDATLPAARLATGHDDLEAKIMPGALKVLADEKRAVVAAVRRAAENPTTTWASAAEQIEEVGEARRSIRIELDDTNQRLDEMAARAVKAEADRATLREIYRKSQAQRDAARRKLSEIDLTPAEEGDYLAMDREGRRAQDILRSAGL